MTLWAFFTGVASYTALEGFDQATLARWALQEQSNYFHDSGTPSKKYPVRPLRKILEKDGRIKFGEVDPIALVQDSQSRRGPGYMGDFDLITAAITANAHVESDSKTDERLLEPRTEPKREVQFTSRLDAHRWPYAPLEVLDSDQRAGLMTAYKSSYVVFDETKSPSAGVLVGPLENSFMAAFRNQRTGKTIVFHHEFCSSKESLVSCLKRELDIKSGDVIDGEFYGYYSYLEWVAKGLIPTLSAGFTQTLSLRDLCNGKTFIEFVEDVKNYVHRILVRMGAQLSLTQVIYVPKPQDQTTHYGSALRYAYVSAGLDVHLICPMLNQITWRLAPLGGGFSDVLTVISLTPDILSTEATPSEGEIARLAKNVQTNNEIIFNATEHFRHVKLAAEHCERFGATFHTVVAQMKKHNALPYIQVPHDWHPLQIPS